MSQLISPEKTDQYNLQSLPFLPWQEENFSVLFDTDLKIAAIFKNSCFDTIQLSSKPSLWLVCVEKNCEEPLFFELKYDAEKGPFIYKRSSAHPEMINQEELRKKAKILFQELLTKQIGKTP